MTVTYSQRGNVALLTIDRPEARNAVNGDVASAMEAAIDQLEAAQDVWAAVLTGTGPVFCAGADLKAIASGQAAGLNTSRGGFAGFVKRHRTKPVIAAVDGPALAGGCEIALACDLIVASTNAAFGVPEVKRSLVAAGGALFRLPQALPRNIAMELILTGDPITAERAHQLGMVNELVEPGQAVDAALALAGRITVNAPLAVRASRSVFLKAIASVDESDMWMESNQAFATVARSEDFAEGPRAFIEKRAPNWQGK
ncbi:MAG TPA: crotonase/enoyl-CoA hydratase family protein [Acidimicrobiales bacterium]|nr:crotonase/enoyl-CoA hydratase family protein [Acidimicrobiales bacterium]